MPDKDWKDALAREVFDWQVRANDQPDRASGWLWAAATAVRFFSEGGGAGSDLTLAASINGPIVNVMGVQDGELVPIATAPGCGGEPPYDLLLRLATEIQASSRELPRVNAVDPGLVSYAGQRDYFFSPHYAAMLAANAVKRVAQDYTCPHPEWLPHYGGGYDEPPWESKVCVRCGTEREVYEAWDNPEEAYAWT